MPAWQSDGRELVSAARIDASADAVFGRNNVAAVTPLFPPGQGTHDADRARLHPGGSLTYLATRDVHRGQVIGRCEDTTGIEPFSRPADQVRSSRRRPWGDTA
jgi:hypothetical protein